MSAQELYIQSMDIAAVASTTEEERHLSHGLDGTYKLEAAYFTPTAAVTAAATNFVTVALNKGAAGTLIASVDTDATGVSFVVGTPTAITISGTGTDLEFTATDGLEVDLNKDGTGGTIEGSITLRWVRARV